MAWVSSVIGGAMGRYLVVNNHGWRISFVSPHNPELIDRTGNYTLGVTVPSEHTIYLSNDLYGNELITVFIHEMTHTVLWEYDIISDIHRYSKPKYAVDMEELVCNIVANYGYLIFKSVYESLGGKAIFYIPQIIERMVA